MGIDTLEDKMKVCGHRLLVKPEVLKSKTDSGIIVVQGDNEKRHRAAVTTGVVLQVGDAAWKGFPDETPWCGVGDRIFYARHSGRFVSLGEEDEDGDEILYYIINDEDVQCVVAEGVRDNLL